MRKYPLAAAAAAVLFALLAGCVAAPFGPRSTIPPNQASAAAASDAAQHQQDALFSQRCAALGGSSHYNYTVGMVCSVNFPDAEDQKLPMNADGSLDPAGIKLNHENCLIRYEDARIGAQDGHPWEYPPFWHSEMGVCDPGHP